MPTYEYVCKSCGHLFEIVRSMKDDSLTECPQCGGELRKVFAPPAISFKGSGFYATDHGRKAKRSDDGKPEGKREGKTDGTPEGKREGTPEGKREGTRESEPTRSSSGTDEKNPEKTTSPTSGGSSGGERSSDPGRSSSPDASG